MTAPGSTTPPHAHRAHTRWGLADAADRASSHSRASIEAIFSTVDPERIVTWR